MRLDLLQLYLMSTNTAIDGNFRVIYIPYLNLN